MGDVDIELYLGNRLEPEATTDVEYRLFARMTAPAFADM